MPTEDRLLDITEAAEILHVSKDWLYRDQKYMTLPFTIILSPRKIRFSLKGLLRWLEEQQGRNHKELHEEEALHAGERVPTS
jgi:predicted DNA-binding transcriptional regulator AlpA